MTGTPIEGFEMWACHSCRMVGSTAQARAYHVERGHDVRLLAQERVTTIWDEWDEVRLLLVRCRLRGQAVTELRPFTVRDGIEAVRALRVLCAEVAMEDNLSHATHHAWSEATALLLRVSNEQIDYSERPQRDL